MPALTETGQRVLGSSPYWDEEGNRVFTAYRAGGLTDAARLVFGLLPIEAPKPERGKQARRHSVAFRLRGRATAWGRVTASTTVKPPALEAVRRRRRPAAFRRGRSRKFGWVLRPPQPGSVSEPRRKLGRNKFPRGRTTMFGRAERVGVTTRPVPPERLTRRRRLAPLPRGSSTRQAWFPRAQPPATIHLVPVSVIRRRRKLEPLPRGRSKPFGRPRRIGAVTRPAPLETLVRRRRGLVPPQARGGRGRTTILGRGSRPGLAGRPPQPLALRRKRAAPPPKGKAKAWPARVAGPAAFTRGQVVFTVVPAVEQVPLKSRHKEKASVTNKG